MRYISFLGLYNLLEHYLMPHSMSCLDRWRLVWPIHQHFLGLSMMGLGVCKNIRSARCNPSLEEADDEASSDGWVICDDTSEPDKQANVDANPPSTQSQIQRTDFVCAFIQEHGPAPAVAAIFAFGVNFLNSAVAFDKRFEDAANLVWNVVESAVMLVIIKSVLWWFYKGLEDEYLQIGDDDGLKSAFGKWRSARESFASAAGVLWGAVVEVIMLVDGVPCVSAETLIRAMNAT